MLVIKIEMWPFGEESKSYPIGRMYIWNKGTAHKQSDGKRGDYGFCIMRKDKVDLHRQDVDETDVVASGNVDNWPRLSYSVWKLVAKCLEIGLGKRNEASK